MNLIPGMWYTLNGGCANSNYIYKFVCKNSMTYLFISNFNNPYMFYIDGIKYDFATNEMIYIFAGEEAAKCQQNLIENTQSLEEQLQSISTL